MYSIPKSLSSIEELSPVLNKLVEKTAIRLRHSGYKTKGVHVAVIYKDRSFWHHGTIREELLFDSRDIYRLALKILSSSPYRKPVANLAVSCFDLEKTNTTQLDLFNQVQKKVSLNKAIDDIKVKWGDFMITPGIMLNTEDSAPDRVGFGNIRDLEQFIVTDPSENILSVI
jgi:hypothetical protein